MISPDFQPAAQPENYAQALLIHSFSLALVFTLLYIPLLGLFVFKAISNPTYVLWITAFFCQGWFIPRVHLGLSGTDGTRSHPVRVVSFAMRAVLAKVESAGENFNLVLAQQIIYGVGFFGILYSAYIMVLDRYGHLTTF